MAKKIFKISIVTILIAMIIGVSFALLFTINNNTETYDMSLQAVSDNASVPTRAGGKDKVQGVWQIAAGTVTYVYEADDGAFWTPDHVQINLTMSKPIPGLKMKVYFYDSKTQNNPLPHVFDIDLNNVTSYNKEVKHTWNQVKQINVELICGSEKLMSEMYLRHD